MKYGDASNTNESANNDAPNGWCTQQVICSWCNTTHVSVHPYGVSAVECPTCSLMTPVGAVRLRVCAAGHRNKRKEKSYRWKDPKFVLLPATQAERTEQEE